MRSSGIGDRRRLHRCSCPSAAAMSSPSLFSLHRDTRRESLTGARVGSGPFDFESSRSWKLKKSCVPIRVVSPENGLRRIVSEQRRRWVHSGLVLNLLILAITVWKFHYLELKMESLKKIVWGRMSQSDERSLLGLGWLYWSILG